MPEATIRQGGHITLLFTVESEQRLTRDQGSCGAGFTVHHGVSAKGTLTVSQQSMTHSAGAEPDKPIAELHAPAADIVVTDAAGMAVIDDRIYRSFIESCRFATLLRPHEHLKLQVWLECPPSQGFGMSAAGLMALGTLLLELTGRGTRRQYLKIAHQVERQHSGGLGDVLGASVGGVELRTHPGAPGWPGRVESFEANTPVLLVWESTHQRHTSSYIDDPDWKEAISRAGQDCMNRLAAMPWNPDAWPSLIHESQIFANASGMMDDPIRASLLNAVTMAIEATGLAGQAVPCLCMLGTSLAVLPTRLDGLLQDEDLQRVASICQQQGLSVLLTRLMPTHSNA